MPACFVSPSARCCSVIARLPSSWVKRRVTKRHLATVGVGAPRLNGDGAPEPLPSGEPNPGAGGWLLGISGTGSASIDPSPDVTGAAGKLKGPPSNPAGRLGLGGQ